MEIKKHAVTGCNRHPRFFISCHDCLVATVIRLCEILEECPNVTKDDESAAANGLAEVFQGIHVAHITDKKITNVTALPMTPADLEEGIVRYTVEFRSDAS